MKHVTAPLSKKLGTTTSNFYSRSEKRNTFSSFAGKITLMLLFLFVSQLGVVAQICTPPMVSDSAATLPNNCTTIPTIAGQSGNVFELTINPANKYTFTLCFATNTTGNSQFPQAELYDDLSGTFLFGTGNPDANNCTTVSYTPPAVCMSTNNVIYLATYSHQCISDWRDLTIDVTCEGCEIACGDPRFAAANNGGCTSFAFDVDGPSVTGSCDGSDISFIADANLAPFVSTTSPIMEGDVVSIMQGAPVGTHIITFSVEDCTGTAVTCEKQVVIEPVLACDDVVNVTLSRFCELQVTPGMLLEAECADDSQYTVNILGQVDDIISAPGMYEVQIVYTPDTPNSASGTFCWGFINAEDKSGPTCTLENPSISVSCGEDPMAGSPVFEDCSGVDDVNMISIQYGICGEIDLPNTAANPDTDGDGDLFDDLPFTINSNLTIPAPSAAESAPFMTAGFVLDNVTVNMWTATDNNGFSSNSCRQFIYKWRPSTVNPPLPSITVECGTAIDQVSVAAVDPRFVPYYNNPKYDTGMGDTDLDNDLEFTLVDNDGDLQFLPIIDVDHSVCRFTVDSSDKLIGELCGNTEKYIREWTVLDWCDGSIVTGLDEFKQIIKIEDTTAPEFTTCPNSLDVGGSFENPLPLFTSSASAGQCGFVGTLTAPTATDFCSEPITYSADIFTSGGTGTGYVLVTQVQDLSNNVSLPTRDYRVDFVATDNCGNPSEVCSVFYDIIDNDSPVAICDQFTTVSLTNGVNGAAEICAENLDSGSADNCGIVSRTIKRMGTPDSLFAECLTLECTDAGQEVMVVFRVMDAAGNSNICIVTVTVDDKVGPTIACPNDITITCLEATTVDVTGDVIMNATSRDGINGFAFDNCNINAVNFTDISNTIDCGAGVIERQFTAFTSTGIATCVQRITVEPDFDFFVTFPADVTIEDCAATANIDMVGEPIISGVTCGEIGINVDDDTYTIQSGACNRIVRTYTIKNTCFDGPIANRTDGGISFAGDPLKFQDDGDGYFRYTQNIDIVDETAPVFDNCSDINIPTFSTTCSENVSIDISATDNCAADLEYFWKVDADSDGTFETFGFDNTITGELPVGTHIGFAQASDGCGNTETCNFVIRINDVKNPTPFCNSGVSTVIMNGPSRSIEVWASDLIQMGSSFDNCTANEDIIVTASLATNPNPTEPSSATSVTITCEDLIRDANGNSLPTSFSIQVFVEDEAGNWDFCTSTIRVIDTEDDCGVSAAGSAQISGRIYNEKDEDVEDVTVQVANNSQNMSPYVTLTDGAFIFSDLTMNNDYSVAPEKNINPANGITTYDLVLMARHILAIELLDSPYKIIAADVTGDGKIDILDLVELRQLILFSISNFSKEKSWKFIDANYQFIDPTNPLDENFPRIIDFADLSANAAADFIGVKVGDLSGDSYANRLLDVSTRSLNPTVVLSTDDQKLVVGEQFEIPFQSMDMDQISALQFTMEFDPARLEFVGVNEGALNISESNFGYTMLDDGVITFSWNTFSGKEVEATTELFAMSFIAKEASNVASEITMNSKFTSATAYNKDGEFNVELNIYSENGTALTTSTFDLYQNEPNPFRSNTSIGFNLPEASSATLTIMDVSGKELRVIKDNFSRGYNEIDLDIGSLNANGVLYYQLETSTHAATRKMIVIE